MTYNNINLPYMQYRLDDIYGEVKKDVTKKILDMDRRTWIFVNFNKLRKNGFYTVQVALKGNEDPSYCSRDVLYESIDLNSEEAFDLADRLSFELMKERGFCWSIGNLKDLPQKFRNHPLVGLKPPA